MSAQFEQSDELTAPQGCAWWTPGDATYHPLQEDFLRQLAKFGFATYTGPSGLAGALRRPRAVVVIFRGRGPKGRGPKWHLRFLDDATDSYKITMTDLQRRTEAARAWLSGEPLDRAIKLVLDGE